MRGMASIWSKKDEWDDTDFGRPVGRNMMKQVNVILEDLKTIIEGKYADFVQATGTTKWVELIEDAYRAVTSTEHKSLHSQAEFIKRKLQEASEDVGGRFEDPQPVSDEDTRLKVNIMKKISYCQELVEIYIVYCNSIYKYVKGLKGLKGAKFENCELISYLQHEGLTKEVACNMCEKLGAIKKQHLYYVNREDIWGDEVNGKQLLDALVTELKAEEKRKNGIIRKQLRALKRVQDEKESAP